MTHHGKVASLWPPAGCCGEDGLSPLVHGSLLGHGGFSWGTEPPGSCRGKGGDSSKGFPKV